MSDTSQGSGWWRASNGLWYPPEARPGQRAPVRSDQESQRGSGAPAPSRLPPGVPPPRRLDPEPQPVHRPRRRRSDDDEGEARTSRLGRHQVEDAEQEEEPYDPTRFRSAYITTFLISCVLAGSITGWLLLFADDGDPVARPTVAASVETIQPPAEVSAHAEVEPDTGEISVFELSVGDCFDLEEIDSGEAMVVTTVRLVGCDEPHRSEIIHVDHLDDPPGAPFPGIEARDEASRALCEPAFEEYSGQSLAASELVLLWLAPTPESWLDDDREVACAVEMPDGSSLTSSVRQGSH